MYEIDFTCAINKAKKSLMKVTRNLEAAKHQQHPDIKRIYLKKAQDRYEEYEMWNNVLPTLAKMEMGNNFNTEDKMYTVLHNVFVDWARDVKEDLDKSKNM